MKAVKDESFSVGARGNPEQEVQELKHVIVTRIARLRCIAHIDPSEYQNDRSIKAATRTHRKEYRIQG